MPRQAGHPDIIEHHIIIIHQHHHHQLTARASRHTPRPTHTADCLPCPCHFPPSPSSSFRLPPTRHLSDHSISYAASATEATARYRLYMATYHHNSQADRAMRGAKTIVRPPGQRPKEQPQQNGRTWTNERSSTEKQFPSWKRARGNDACPRPAWQGAHVPKRRPAQVYLQDRHRRSAGYQMYAYMYNNNSKTIDKTSI